MPRIDDMSAWMLLWCGVLDQQLGSSQCFLSHNIKPPHTDPFQSRCHFIYKNNLQPNDMLRKFAAAGRGKGACIHEGWRKRVRIRVCQDNLLEGTPTGRVRSPHDFYINDSVKFTDCFKHLFTMYSTTAICAPCTVTQQWCSCTWIRCKTITLQTVCVPSLLWVIPDQVDSPFDDSLWPDTPSCVFCCFTYPANLWRTAAKS